VFIEGNSVFLFYFQIEILFCVVILLIVVNSSLCLVAFHWHFLLLVNCPFIVISVWLWFSNIHISLTFIITSVRIIINDTPFCIQIGPLRRVD
jgi:hypothetical protein